MLSVAVLAACQAEYSDDYGYTYEEDQPSAETANYMLGLGEMVAYNLKVLETALIYDANDELRDLFNKSGKSMWEDGVSFNMSDGQLVDLKISKVAGADSWKLEYNGDYTIGGYTYNTAYTITATILDKDAGVNNHYDWNAVVDGTRNEREGYKSEFGSSTGLKFTRGASASRWDRCDGTLKMTVFHKGKKVDLAMLVFKGEKDDYTFTRFPVAS